MKTLMKMWLCNIQIKERGEKIYGKKKSEKQVLRK